MTNVSLPDDCHELIDVPRALTRSQLRAMSHEELCLKNAAIDEDSKLGKEGELEREAH